MNVKLHNYVRIMTKLAIQVFVICQSLLMTFASDLDAQRKYLHEIEIDLPAYDQAALKVLIKDIEGRSDFEFAFPKRLISSKTLSLQEGRWNMESLLKEISTQARISIKRINETISFSDVEPSRTLPDVIEEKMMNVVVSGTVTDERGDALPGATVLEKGTTNGTTTDIDGKFQLNVTEDAVLTVSFVGFTTQDVQVNNRSIIDIKLDLDAAQLEEVVVVGYGEQKLKEVTGSVVNIPVEDIAVLPLSNLSQALVGQIPGLSVNGGSKRPGDAATLSIRQTFSFSKDGGSDVPLIIIDDMIQVDPETGLPSLALFNSLTPQEIESITVLKDGSAAIYGARASQGAILVKTKRGKIGKTKFNYSGQFSFNDAISHSETMSAYEFGVWHNRFLKAGNRDNNGQNLFSPDELEEMKGLDYNWLDETWKSASQYRHSLTLSGGGEKATYFAGVTYFTQGANFGSQDYGRWNFRTGLDVKITEDLQLSGTIAAITGDVEKSFTKVTSGINDSSYGSKARSGTEQADYGYLLHMPKYIPWQTTIDGEDYWVSPFPRTDRNLGSANTNRTIAGWNYLAMLNSGSKIIDKDFSYNANFSLRYSVPFIKGLSFKGTFARTQTSSSGEQIQLPFTLARYTKYNNEGKHLASEAEDSEWKIEENVRNSRVYYGQSTSISTQANFFISYNQSFGDHEISAMTSVERSESSYANSRVGYENTDADYLGTSKTAGELSDNTYATKGEFGTLSYLGRLNYSYQSKYLLQFLFRSDASTKFAPENYWGFFPSAQAGWIVSEENWFRNALPWADFLKLRYSIGKTGKDNIKAWRWAQYYSIIVDKGFQFGGNGGELGSAITPDVTPNRNVGWDTTIKHDLGLDLNVLDNRLGITFDYYFDRTTDMLTNMAGAVGVPISVGGGFAEENFAAVDAWGKELSISWSDNIRNDFSYRVGVVFGLNNNKIRKYPEQALLHPSENQVIAGRSSIFPVWGFETWKGTSTGDGILRTDEDIQNYWNYLVERATAAGTDPDYLGINSVDGIMKGMLAYKDVGGDFNSEDGTQLGPDGRIDKTLDYVKLVDQDRAYGFTTNIRLNYKGISLSTQISTSWGGYRPIDVVKQGTSSSHNMWAHESYWADMYDPDDNVNGKYPNLAYEDQILAPSDFWQLNTFRSFVRNLHVSYDLPARLISKMKIDRASIGVTGYNLWDFYNPYPEDYRNMYDNSYEGYPTLRTWAVNLNVAF